MWQQVSEMPLWRRYGFAPFVTCACVHEVGHMHDAGGGTAVHRSLCRYVGLGVLTSTAHATLRSWCLLSAVLLLRMFLWSGWMLMLVCLHSGPFLHRLVYLARCSGRRFDDPQLGPLCHSPNCHTYLSASL